MNNILEYLEKTAEERSRHVAVDDGSISFTWTELLDLSRKIGSAFCKKTDKGKPIVLLMEKSAVTLAAMFGTVYAGCFYVVIDPTQPPERISEIFRVLSPELVVTNKENENLLEQAGYSGCKYFLKDAMHEEINMEKLVSIREKSRDTDLLYGIFTSGSTGVPKGVVVSHRAVMDFIPHFADTFGVTADDRIGNQAPFDFDVSVKDIYTSLYTGAKLIIIPKELFSTPPRLLDYLCEKRVTTLIWAVSALSLIASLKGLDYKVPCDVNKILFSGEVMPVKILRKWQAALPHAEYVNLYGPAEITCNCTYHRVTEMPQDGEKIPIGKAFAGREVFLIDEDGEKEEIAYPGIIGEICVSGESLSEGYYHNPEETKK